jgi:hypothetical protein
MAPPPSGALPPFGGPPADAVTGRPQASVAQVRATQLGATQLGTGQKSAGQNNPDRVGTALAVTRAGNGGTNLADPVAATREQKRTWQLVIGGLGALVLVAVCGLSSYFMVTDERQGRAVRDAAAPTTLPRDISSRSVDPAPLTEPEVFPAGQIVINPAEPPYQVLKTQNTTDCATAATREISGLLAELGCTQVVRGTLRSPSGGYVVTAGLFNLADATGAEWAHQKIKQIVDGDKGRFRGLAAGKGTEAVALASAQVGWHVRGHFLIFCVIAKTDSTAIGDNDPHARQILFDLIELHLRGSVLERRATVPVGSSTGATPAA